MDIMRKRISLLLSIVMLCLAIMPVMVVNAAEASQVTMTAKMGSTVLKDREEYNVNGGEKITVTASSTMADIDYIGYYYTYASGDKAIKTPVTDIKSNSITITIPEKVYGTKNVMWISIEAVAKNDNGVDNLITKSGWLSCKLLYSNSSSTTTPTTEPTTEPTTTVNGDIVVKANGKVVNNGSRTTVNPGTVVNFTATPANELTKINYQLSNGQLNTLVSSNTHDVTIPANAQPGEEYVLKIAATYKDGTVVGYETYTFVIAGTTPSTTPSINGDIKVVVDNVEVKNGSLTEVKPGTPVNISILPADKVANMKYRLGEGQLNTITSNTKTVKVPDTAKEGEVYILAVSGTLTDGTTLPQEIYKFVVKGDPKHNSNDLDIEPWMEENEYIEKLSITLRNDSEEEEKANKNIYELNETVTYYIDYKNGGKEINDKVTIKLELPLKYTVVDADGGTVDGDTIVWTFADGLDEGEAGTLIVKIKYTALKRSKDDSNTIYPSASILQGSKVKDVSTVINLIITSYDEVIELEHEPYMFGDANADTFRPDYIISRAEGALVLARIFNLDYRNIKNITTRYTDIDETYYEAQQAITAASEAGLLNGYREDDGTYTFRPNDKMTKAEFIKILARMIEEFAEDEGIDGLEVKELDNLVKTYADTKAYYMVEGKRVYTHWALEELTQLARLNMLPFLTEDDPTFTIDDKITRAEVAQLINAYLLRAPAEITSKTKINFSDVSKKHKLVADIVEATRDSHWVSFTSDATEVAEKIK